MQLTLHAGAQHDDAHQHPQEEEGGEEEAAHGGVAAGGAAAAQDAWRRATKAGCLCTERGLRCHSALPCPAQPSRSPSTPPTTCPRPSQPVPTFTALAFMVSQPKGEAEEAQSLGHRGPQEGQTSVPLEEDCGFAERALESHFFLLKRRESV